MSKSRSLPLLLRSIALGLAALALSSPSSARQTNDFSGLDLAGKTQEINYQPDAIPHSQHNAEDTLHHDQANQEYYLAIYSGSPTGVYFEVASTLCSLMRQTYKQHRIRCVPLRSNGSSDNIRLMQEGRAQLAIVQSDVNWAAAHNPKQASIARSVMSLHNEMGLIVARSDAKIQSIADLRGKRVNVGPEASAQRQMWQDLLATHGMKLDTLGKVHGAVQDFNKTGLCLNYIDAFGLWIGHPAKVVSDTLSSCPARLIGMSDANIDAMLAKSQYLFRQTLPANTYPGQHQPIKSYGLKATLIAAKQANPYVIYWLTRIVRENATALGKAHLFLRGLNPDELRDTGNFLRFHDGAECYWKKSAESCAWQTHYPAFAKQ